MSERYRSHPHELSLHGHHVALWNSPESISRSGVSTAELHHIAQEVADAVNLYIEDHPSEMLRKTPENILEQLFLGRTCLIAVREGSRWEFGYHGSMYPMFENGEENITGTQIVELGTDITNARYRGQGLGQLGLQTRLQMLEQWQTPHVSVFGLATVKRMVTGYVYGKMNVHPVSYYDHPYVAFLTDTCENSSERFGHESCEFRRQPNESTRESLQGLFQQIGANAYIPCTVVVTNQEQARHFDDRMRTLHQAWLCENIPQGEISREAYQSIEAFYFELTRRSTQR